MHTTLTISVWTAVPLVDTWKTTMIRLRMNTMTSMTAPYATPGPSDQRREQMRKKTAKSVRLVNPRMTGLSLASRAPLVSLCRFKNTIERNSR